MIGHQLDTHPSGDQLAAFALGHLDDSAATPIADHLGDCEACQQAVRAVPNDALLSLLRPSGSTPLPQPQLLGTTGFEDAVPPELSGHARYQVLRRLGAGGMGVVYQAEHRLMGRTVALKLINKELIVAPGVVERFQREVRAVARLAHPDLVQAFDADKAGELHFLVLEFIDGITLDTLVKRDGPLPVDRACDCVRQAALGLAHAAAQGLVHRDVKPQNIMVTPQGQVKVMDFGLASISAERGGEGGLTEAGQGFGTPDYIAPEQVRDAHAADARADLYSLGCTFYFLLTGRPLFPKGNQAQKLAAHLEQQPEPLAGLRPELPAGLVQVIEKMMAKDPAQRYQTAAAVVAALEPWCQARTPPSPRPRWRKRLAVAAGLLALVGVAASLVTVAFLARPPSKEVTPPEDPRVLTVSKRPEDRGRFRTIKEALDEVEPGMTIRVLDDAVYEEHLLITNQHRGVVLEAVGKASIRRPPGDTQAVFIQDVPGFTLRGFRFASPPDKNPTCQVYIAGLCPGVVLDRLDMTTGGKECVDLHGVPLSGKDAPIVIQNCTMRGGETGVLIEGSVRDNIDHPLPCGHVVIRDNTMVECTGVQLRGAIQQVHVVGNRFLDSKWNAIDLFDLLPGTADILVANNTLFRCRAALVVKDDHSKGKDFLKCKNIRIHNNLVLAPSQAADLWFLDHVRGITDQTRPGDLQALLKSPQWRFSHNWREIDELLAAARHSDAWIPRCPDDQLQVPIKVLSRTLGHPNFLRPAKDSPLATAGAGVKDSALPGYVRAVPPEEVEPWDWDRTWKALAHAPPDVQPGDAAPDLSQVKPLIDDDFSDP